MIAKTYRGRIIELHIPLPPSVIQSGNVNSFRHGQSDAILAAAEIAASADARIERLEKALIRLRDCDWVITPHDRMDAVRQIAREALGHE